MFEVRGRARVFRYRPGVMAAVLAALLACGTVHAEAGTRDPDPRPRAGAPRVRDGDIIFQTSRSEQSLAIQRATASPYSHMGLIVHRGGRPYVFEASATVRFTPLRAWIERGEGGRYVVKRLRDAASRITPAALERARAVAKQYDGKKYDLTFAWSDERMYCSELVWKIYKNALGVEIGGLQRLRDFRLDDPAVKAKLKERYGRDLPLDEPVISPAAMFASPSLETVAQR